MLRPAVFASSLALIAACADVDQSPIEASAPPRLARPLADTSTQAVHVDAQADDAATQSEDAAWLLEDAAVAPPSAPTAPSAPRAGGRPSGVATCYSALSSSHPATVAFWAALRAGDLEGRPRAIEALTAAAAEYPNEEEFALLLGLAHLWRVAEPNVTELFDFAGLLSAVDTTRAELERAAALCPTDHRIAAWLGPVLIRSGRMANEPAEIDRGMAILDAGIEAYPAFVLFSKVLVYADQPADDPDFVRAVEAITANIGACGPTDPACGNHPKVAHNLEGSAVFLGDVYAKAGDRARALAAYQGARASADYASWDYDAVLSARISALDLHMASARNENPFDDPQWAWSTSFQCSICHRE